MLFVFLAQLRSEAQEAAAPPASPAASSSGAPIANMRINLADGIGFDFGYSYFGIGIYQWSAKALGTVDEAISLSTGYKEGVRFNYYISRFGQSGFYLSAGLARIVWSGRAARESDSAEWFGSGGGSMKSAFVGYTWFRQYFNFNIAVGSQQTTVSPIVFTSTTAAPLNGLPLTFSYGGFDVGVGIHF